MDLATVLRWAARRWPDRRAVGGTEPLTYREWDGRVCQVARALAANGVGPGDRVGFCLAGGEPLATAHLAAQKLGAASVPLSTRFGADELGYCLDDAEVRLVVSDGTTADRVPGNSLDIDELRRQAEREPQSDPGVTPDRQDTSVVLYTSGTTGRPKGVPRSHTAEHAASVAHLIQTEHRAGQITLGVMPLFHTMGLRSLLASVIGGGTWVPQARFDAEESLALIERDAVSTLYLVPTIYWSLLRTGRLAECRSVRRLAYAGATMTPALAEELAAALHPEVFVNHFGSTEVYTFTIFGDVARKPGCAGRAGVFGQVRLVDPDPAAPPDALVAAGQPGQVAVSMAGPEAFAGYWRRPDADAKAIRDGWYFTGDLAVADDEGDLWVTGRVDDMINSGGENLYPDEIEAALVRCPAVADLVVTGLPDDRWGQAVTAFVVPADGRPPQQVVADVHDYARQALPALKRPKRVIVVESIPKSAVGKILRRTLSAGEYTALAEGSSTGGNLIAGRDNPGAR
jgi:2-furoate---CoA ligase